MKQENNVIVAGLGEVGRPLLGLLSKHYEVIGVDITPPPGPIGKVDVLHVCYPYEIPDFIGETVRYIEMFKPRLTIINSTVGVGTTRAIAQKTGAAGAALAHSPVRGKHVRMLQELQKYTKFVGPMDAATGTSAAEHFEAAGLKVRVLSNPEATELAKLTETTYFGLLIAWAQELERYCDRAGASYEEIIGIYEEIAFFPPVKYFPGVIGGHCVMPNIQILKQFTDSRILEAIEASNREKTERETSKGAREEVAKATS